MGIGADFKKRLAEAKKEGVDLSKFAGADAWATQVETVHRTLEVLLKERAKVKSMLAEPSKADEAFIKSFRNGVIAARDLWHKIEVKVDTYQDAVRQLIKTSDKANKSKGFSGVSDQLRKIQGEIGGNTFLKTDIDDLLAEWAKAGVAKEKKAADKDIADLKAEKVKWEGEIKKAKEAEEAAWKELNTVMQELRRRMVAAKAIASNYN